MALLGWNDYEAISDEAPDRKWKRRMYYLGVFFPKLFVLNLLLLVTCAGIVTIPAALAGAGRACFQIIRKKRFSILHDFFGEVRADFKRSFLAGFFLLFLLVFAGAAAHLAVAHFAGALRYAAVGFSGFVMLFSYLLLCYVTAMVALTDLRIADLLHNAVLLIFLARRETFLLISLGAILLLLLGFFPYSIIVILFGVPAFLAYGGCTASYRAAKRFVLREEDEAEEEEPG